MNDLKGWYASLSGAMLGKTMSYNLVISFVAVIALTALGYNKPLAIAALSTPLSPRLLCWHS